MYIIDRLIKASDYSSAQPVERLGAFSVKRVALKEAKRLANGRRFGTWVQVRDATNGAILVTYDNHGNKV